MNADPDAKIRLLARLLGNMNIDVQKRGQVNILGLCAGALHALCECRRCEKLQNNNGSTDNVTRTNDIYDLIAALQYDSAPPTGWLYGYHKNDAGLRIALAYEGTLSLLIDDRRKKNYNVPALRRLAEQMGVLRKDDDNWCNMVRQQFRNPLVHEPGVRVNAIIFEVPHLLLAAEELVAIFRRFVQQGLSVNKL